MKMDPTKRVTNKSPAKAVRSSVSPKFQRACVKMEQAVRTTIDFKA
jgi:hypothetical protein